MAPALEYTVSSRPIFTGQPVYKAGKWDQFAIFNCVVAYAFQFQFHKQTTFSTVGFLICCSFCLENFPNLYLFPTKLCTRFKPNVFFIYAPFLFYQTWLLAEFLYFPRVQTESSTRTGTVSVLFLNYPPYLDLSSYQYL